MNLEEIIYLKFIPPIIILIIKAIFISFGIVAIGVILFILKKTDWLKYRYLQDTTEFLTFKAYGTQKNTKDWLKITKRLDSGLESEYKLAVIEADGMLDNVLKKMGYQGETLGDRLKQLTPETCSNIEDVWTAHKIRNDIVHDPDYRLSLEETRKALTMYEKAFQELEII